MLHLRYSRKLLLISKPSHSEPADIKSRGNNYTCEEGGSRSSLSVLPVASDHSQADLKSR